MNDTIDLNLNPDPVCPHCGYEHQDAWELQLSDGDVCSIWCHNCKKPFLISCRIDITYSTRTLTDAQLAYFLAEEHIFSERCREKHFRFIGEYEKASRSNDLVVQMEQVLARTENMPPKF